MKLSEQLKVDGANWLAAGETKMGIRVIGYAAKAEVAEEALAALVAAANAAYEYIETEPVHDDERCPMKQLRAAVKLATIARGIAESA